MSENNPLGSLDILIGADWSGLQQSISDAVSAAQKGGEQIANAFNNAGSAAGTASGGVGELAEQFTALAGALAVTEGLREFGAEALKAYGTVQSVTIGLTQLTGSAEKANDIIEQVKQLAATEPFAFPEIAPTIQKMVALGVSAEQIPAVMQAVADSAAATGNSFQQVANSFDRMALTGTVNARSLVQLGISTHDLGAAMGVADSEVKTFFASLDQSTRIDVLDQALTKFAGSAEAQAKGIAGEWTIFQNQFEEVMVGVGQALTPVVSEILAFGTTVLNSIKEAEDAFEKLPEPVKDVAVVLGLAVAALVPLAAGISALGFAIIGFNTAWATGATILGTFTGSAEGAAIAEGELATSAVAATTAEEAQIVATGELVTAEEALAGSAGAAATGIGLISGAVGVLTGALAGLALSKWINDNLPGLQKYIAMLAGPIGDVVVAFREWKDATEAADTPLLTITSTVEGLGSVLPGLQSGIVDVTDKLRILTAGFDAVVKVQMDANAAVGQARVAYGLAKDALDNAIPGTQQYANALLVLNRAQIDLDNAIQKANPHGKDWADTIGGISEAAAKAQEKFQSLSTIFNQLAAAAANGASNNAALAEAYTKLESAAKASGNAFASYQGIIAQVNQETAQGYANTQQLGAAFGTLLDLQKTGVDVSAQLADVYARWQSAAKGVGEAVSSAAGEMAKLVAAAQGQQSALEGSVGAFEKLAAVQQPTIAQQLALQAAFKQVTTNAQTMGIQLQVAGNSIVFMAKAGENATPAVLAYIAQLNAMFASTSNLVKVNEQFVTDSTSLTGAYNTLATGATTAATATKAHGDAASGAAAPIGDYAKAISGAGAVIVDVNHILSDSGVFFRSNAEAVKLLAYSHGDLSAAADQARKEMDALDEVQSRQAHTTIPGGIDETEKWSVSVHNLDGSIGTLTISVQGADHDVEDFGQTLTNADETMKSATGDAYDLAGGFSAAAAAAYDAATAVNSLAEADTGFSSSSFAPSNFGGQGGGGTAHILPGSYVTVGEPSATGTPMGIQQGNAPIPTDPNPGTDYFDLFTGTWKPIPKNTDQFGRPLPASSSSSNTATPIPSSTSSGITALASAAGSAATSVTAMSTATDATAQPLGSFVTSVTNAASAIPTITNQVKASSEDIIKAIADSGLKGALSAVSDGANSAGDNLYTLTQISGNQVQTMTDTADALVNLMNSANGAAAGTAAVDDSSRILDSTIRSTSVQASDLESDFSTLSQKSQDYYTADAAAINATNAYTNALNSGTASITQLAQLLASAQDAMDKVLQLTGTAAVPENNSVTAPIVFVAPTPTLLSSLPGSNVFNPANSIYAPGTGTGTGGLGSLNSPLSITVNLSTGPIVGTNAASILTDAMAPQLVAKLRQAGVKL